MRPRTQKQPQVKKELCRVLDDVDVDVDSQQVRKSGFSNLAKHSFLRPIFPSRTKKQCVGFN